MVQPVNMKQGKAGWTTGNWTPDSGLISSILKPGQPNRQLVVHLAAGARLMCWSSPTQSSACNKRAERQLPGASLLPFIRPQWLLVSVSHWTLESPTIYLLEMQHLLSNRREKDLPLLFFLMFTNVTHLNPLFILRVLQLNFGFSIRLQFIHFGFVLEFIHCCYFIPFRSVLSLVQATVMVICFQVLLL